MIGYFCFEHKLAIMNTYDILGIQKPQRMGRKSAQTGGKKNVKLVKGGAETKAHVERDMTEKELTPTSEIETYEPKITRPTMSIFEYAEVHTMLAEYIAANKSIKNFIDDVEVRGNVNPAELAFHLLKEGKWDAKIDRGYEVVSYSKLKINPQWETTILNYFNQQHETQKKELFEPLGLL